jgi:type IV secretion system protein VirB4
VAKLKKSDNNLYNKTSEDFIPAVCHYDHHTLLTKNGELLQTIQIDGLHSKKISPNLSNLRTVVREAIKGATNHEKFAFWIHTIRRKDNLDDNEGYEKLLSANIHDIWRRENYWDDKFVNCLYITIVHGGPEVKVTNLSSWLNSLSTKTISDFEEKYFVLSHQELDQTTSEILNTLKEYGAHRLEIYEEDGIYYSDPMFLYRRIMQLSEEKCPVPNADISSILASHHYAVGSDKLEVIGHNGKKFATLLSIKEYRDVSAESIDRFLQIPIEMIVTEVFYFIQRENAIKNFEEQNYILELSKDSELKELKGLNAIMDKEQNTSFCHQQISFMLAGDDLKMLDEQVQEASSTLSKIGVLHAREDINLEKTFWAQLPANFAFLTRMKPTIFSNTAALASLHNFPIGNQYTTWGKAVTLLKTEKGTPYFMNFHDQTNKGTTCIFGPKETGKTTLLNFFISEADKYNPITLYITNRIDSEIYIKARGGRWLQQNKNTLNPFLCEDTENNRNFVFHFFTIIAKHYFDPLSENEIDILKTISESIFSLPMEERKLSIFAQALGDVAGAENLQKRLSAYMPKGEYFGIFEQDTPIQLAPGDLIGINLQDFDDDSYTQKNYPQEKKHLKQFEYNLNSMRSVKAAIILAFQNILENSGNSPKIFAIDNLSEILDFTRYEKLFSVINENMNNCNGVFVSTLNTENLQNLYKQNIAQDWIKHVNTSFILPSELSTSGLDKVLNIDRTSLTKLSKLSRSSRMFLIKQDDKTIAAELKLDELPGLARLLSSAEQERKIYKEIVDEFGEDSPEDWVQALYEKLEEDTL